MQLHTLDSQFSYKRGLGTELCVWTLKSIIGYYTSRGSPVYLCFLDASKAFDRVNYWKLFNKLLLRGAPKHLINLLIFWYTNQNFTVGWGSSMSPPFTTANGIRQGGIISPYLYNVYMDGLSARLRDTGVGCHVSDRCINSLSYADDMVLLAPTVEALQRLLAVCQEYATQHDMLYNTTKTECMIIPPKRSRVMYQTSAKLSECPLRFVDSFTYLGHIVSQDMTDDADIRKQTRQLTVVGNSLLRKFSYCSQEVKMELFRSHCYSLYCNSLWSQYRAATMKKLKVCHNDILKRLLGLPRWASSSLAFAGQGLKCLAEIRRHAACSMRDRVRRSSNSIISSVRCSSAYVLSPLYHEWYRLLFL